MTSVSSYVNPTFSSYISLTPEDVPMVKLRTRKLDPQAEKINERLKEQVRDTIKQFACVRKALHDLFSKYTSKTLPDARDVGLSQVQWLDIYWNKLGKERGSVLRADEKEKADSYTSLWSDPEYYSVETWNRLSLKEKLKRCEDAFGAFWWDGGDEHLVAERNEAINKAFGGYTSEMILGIEDSWIRRVAHISDIYWRKLGEERGSPLTKEEKSKALEKLREVRKHPVEIFNSLI